MFRTPPLPIFEGDQKARDMYYYNIPNSAEYTEFLKKQNSLELRNPVFMRPTPRKILKPFFQNYKNGGKNLLKET